MQLSQFKEYKPPKVRTVDSRSRSRECLHLEMKEDHVAGTEAIGTYGDTKSSSRKEWRRGDTEEELERLTVQSNPGTRTVPPRDQLLFPSVRYQNLNRPRKLRNTIPRSIAGSKKRTAICHDHDLKLLESMKTSVSATCIVASPFEIFSASEAGQKNLRLRLPSEMFFPQNNENSLLCTPNPVGEQVIGRIDPVMERSKDRLLINSCTQTWTPSDEEIASKIRRR